jgi:DNA-binding NtrC family response regulator
VSLSEEALDALERWSWPGNVRELENVIRRAAVFAHGAIGVADLPAPIGTAA